MACAPDQPPLAVHPVAFVALQLRREVPPLATLVGFALRLTAGDGAAAGSTVTVAAD